MTRIDPEAIMEIMRKLLEKISLSLNEQKSRIVTAKGGFEFIGFHFFRRYSTRKEGKSPYSSHRGKLWETSRKRQSKSSTGRILPPTKMRQ